MIYLLYFIYAKINGETEAFLYSRKGAEALPENEHRWFVKERVLFAVCILTGSGYAFCFSWWAILLANAEFAAAVLAFSFFRDGFYYRMRDRIDGTAHGWRHQSTTDSSKIHFDYAERHRLFLYSLALLAISYTLYYILK